MACLPPARLNNSPTASMIVSCLCGLCSTWVLLLASDEDHSSVSQTSVHFQDRVILVIVTPESGTSDAVIVS